MEVVVSDTEVIFAHLSIHLQAAEIFIILNYVFVACKDIIAFVVKIIKIDYLFVLFLSLFRNNVSFVVEIEDFLVLIL